MGRGRLGGVGLIADIKTAVELQPLTPSNLRDLSEGLPHTLVTLACFPLRWRKRPLHSYPTGQGAPFQDDIIFEGDAT